MPRNRSNRLILTSLFLSALLLTPACGDGDGPRRGVPTGGDVGIIIDSGDEDSGSRDAGFQDGGTTVDPDDSGFPDPEDPIDVGGGEDPIDAEDPADVEDVEDPAETGGPTDTGSPTDTGGPADVDPSEDTDADPAHPTWVSAEAFELYELIMAYRLENGLPEIPLSRSLSDVASAHVGDLNDHPETTDGECNLHSWSDQGTWTACCYTPDHDEAQCMWDKPRELSDYPGNGYEISAMSTRMTPSAALGLWQNSSGHNAVILNEGIWTTAWGAIGVGIAGQYAHVWFGREADPAN